MGTLRGETQAQLDAEENVWVLIRGDALEGLRSDKVLVGVWVDEEWVELPFIVLPLTNNSYSLDPGAPRRLDPPYSQGPRTALYVQPRWIDPRRGILVPLTDEVILRARRTPARDWSPEALRRNYARRAIYSYRGVIIEVYSPLGGRAPGRTPLLPPLVEGGRTSIYSVRWRAGRAEPLLLVDKLSPEELYQAYGAGISSAGYSTSPQVRGPPQAGFMGVELLPEAKRTPSSGAYLWYARCWRDGRLASHIAGGNGSIVITDYFTTKANTSRFDLLLSLRPLNSTGRTINVEVYINDTLILRDSIAEASGASYKYLAYTWSPDPEDISNNIWEVKVVLSGLDPGASRWLLDAVPTARAWIQPATPQNEVRGVDAVFLGSSSVRYHGSRGDPVSGQYEFSAETGDAVLVILGSPNIVEGLSPSETLIRVRSTEHQRYDRRVHVYVDGYLAGSCLARAPGVPNGTEASRGCTVQIPDVSPYIAGALREASHTTIRVVIEGYMGPTGPDAHNWFLSAGRASFYTRSFLYTGNPYNGDPTLPPSRNDVYLIAREYYVGSSPQRGPQAHKGMQETLVVLSYPPRIGPWYTTHTFYLIVPIRSTLPATGQPSHRLVEAHISFKAEQSGANYTEVHADIYTPPGTKEAPRAVGIMLRLAALLSRMLAPLGWAGRLLSPGSSIIEAPWLCYHGASYTYRKTSHGVEIQWDAGYSHISSGEFRVALMLRRAWNRNPVDLSVEGYVVVQVSKPSPPPSHASETSLLRLDLSRAVRINYAG